jgi:hypothetical protein
MLEERMTTATHGDLTTAVSRLVVARDGDEHVLGRPDLGLYVEVPAPGAVCVEALQAGASLADATARASDSAGQPVDGEDFVATLIAAGLLDPVDATGSTGAVGSANPAAPVRGREIRWIEGVTPRLARRLFGRAAWFGYAAAAVLVIALLAGEEHLRPTFEHFYFLGDPVLSILCYAPIAVLLGATHEAWHWLAGRAIGIPAAFRVSNRGVFLVFETDLTQIVATPRRRRYGAFFAGMAFDVSVLALALLARWFYQRDVLALPALVYRLLGAMVLAQLLAIVWQWAAVFLRSDVYAALANALRCNNLYRVTWLTVKDRLWPLTPAQQQELADASPRDRAVARWFGGVYMLGIGGMCWTVLTFGVPSMISVGGWLASNLATRTVTSVAFWESVVVAGFLAVNWGGPALLALRERRLRARGVSR